MIDRFASRSLERWISRVIDGVDARRVRAIRRFLHVMYLTSVFCCWFMWVVIYMAQMKPLVRPVSIDWRSD